jgi:16S rRNA (guanine966-N2)-methyltransferase
MLGSVAGRRVLDLYAGSGAVGLEALSRGAAEVLLVESERRAHSAVTANIAAVGLGGATASLTSVERLVGQANHGPAYDVVVLDPPYSLAAPALSAVLADVLANGWLAPGGVAVVERATRDPAWGWPAGLAEDRSRAYGEATLWYGRAADSAGQDGRSEPRS